MKKRILSAVCALAMLFAAAPAVFAADQLNTVKKQVNFDPYSDTYAVECYSYQNWTDGGLNINGDIYQGKNMAGGGSTNNYLIFKDMNFSTVGAGAIKVWTAVDGDYNGKLEIRENGPDGTILLEIPSYNNGSWTTPAERTIDISDPTKFSGTKTLCFRWTDLVGNFYKFRFEDEWDKTEKPQLAMRSGTSAASDISAADNFVANASVCRNSKSAETEKAALLLAQYDGNGTMITLSLDEEELPNGGAKKTWNFTGSSIPKTSGAKAVGLYFWKNNGKTIYAEGVNTGSPKATTKTSSEKIDVSVDNAIVTVCGSDLTSERVIVAVVPKNYNSTVAIYNQAVQLYELVVTGGKYAYSYRMRDDVATGDYKMLVFDGATTLEKEFHYTSPNDVYNVLDYLSKTSYTDDEIVDKIRENAGVFGTKAEYFNNMSSADKTKLNSMMKDYFAQNPLSKIDNYDSWTTGLKNIILPQSVISAIKTANDAQYVVDLLDNYAHELNIDGLSKYTDYTKGNKKQIAKELMNIIADNCDMNSIAGTFKDAVILGYFNSASSWGYIDEAIKAYSGDLGLDLTVYSRLLNSPKEKFCNSFLDQGFGQITNISDKFNTLIPGYNTPENTTSDKYETLVISPSDEIYRYEVLVEPTENPNDDFVAFDDLEDVLWARRAILNMKYQGYVNGKTETKFCPNDTITREEFAAILVRCFKLGEASPETLEFWDVNKNAWYASYIATAVNYGIVNGVDEYSFGTGQNVTREQIAAMLQRAVAAVGKSIIPKKSVAAFTDSSYIADYAYPAVTELAKAEIVNGTGGGAFSPWKPATRAEAVVMLSRLLENIK